MTGGIVLAAIAVLMVVAVFTTGRRNKKDHEE